MTAHARCQARHSGGRKTEPLGCCRLANFVDQLLNACFDLRRRTDALRKSVFVFHKTTVAGRLRPCSGMDQPGYCPKSAGALDTAPRRIAGHSERDEGDDDDLLRIMFAPGDRPIICVELPRNHGRDRAVESLDFV